MNEKMKYEKAINETDKAIVNKETEIQKLRDHRKFLEAMRDGTPKNEARKTQ